jgi:hypothetical protein
MEASPDKEDIANFANTRRDYDFTMRTIQCFQKLTARRLNCIEELARQNRREQSAMGRMPAAVFHAAHSQDAETLRKCAHEPCRCLVPSTQEYCGAYCSRADDVENTELQCDCGHEMCTVERAHRLSAACIEGQGVAGDGKAAGRAAVPPQSNRGRFAN